MEAYEITFWYTLGLITGVLLGIILSFKYVKCNSGPPFRVQEEHGISLYEEAKDGTA